MATYHADNLSLMVQPVGNAPRWWTYYDTGAAVTDIVASGFVADGKDKGMKVDDLVVFHDKTNNRIWSLRVSAVQDTGATQVTLDGQVSLGDTS